MRSALEYASIIWDPYLQKDVTVLNEFSERLPIGSLLPTTGSIVCHVWWENYNWKHYRSIAEFNVWHLCTRFSMARWRCQPNWLIWNYLYVLAEEYYNQQKLYKPRTHTTEYQKSFVHSQSHSGILFLHQLLSPTQYLPSSVGSPLFRRAQPLVAVIASGSWWLLSRSRSRSRSRAPLRETASKALRHDTCSQGISQFYLHTRTFIRNRNEPYLPVQRPNIARRDVLIQGWTAEALSPSCLIGIRLHACYPLFYNCFFLPE